MNKPFAALKEGALIGVIAPAGPAQPEHLVQVAPLLSRYGFRSLLYPGCTQNIGYLAGHDTQRLADLHAAFENPDVQAILCLRGGYGSARLLDGINTALLQRHAKLLVGYSDITALHALLNRAGITSLHAPMPASDLVRDGHDADTQALFKLLREGLSAGSTMQPALDPEGMRIEGIAEGHLIGGNLSLVASLIGTPWACPVENAILFLEDINEEPYRVDRLLNQLRLAGVLSAARGFLLGSFSEEASPRAVLDEYLRPLHKPVLGGWPAGHGVPNRPLPLGARVSMDSARGTLTLLEDVVLPPPTKTVLGRPSPGSSSPTNASAPR